MRNFFRQPAVRLYLLGQGLIFVGAWTIDATGSFAPMALAGSAAVMLSVPLVRERFARARAARAVRRD